MDDGQREDLGIVYKKTIGSYTVQAGGRLLTCTLSSRLRAQPGYNPADASRDPGPRRKVRERRPVRTAKTPQSPDPVVVGDRVRFSENQAGSGMIVDVLPRRNQLARRSPVPMPSARPYEQIIAANLDQVVPVFAAANPTPKWHLLDRYLVSAEAADIPALVCITKHDLVHGNGGPAGTELEEALEAYRQIGYPVILTSAVTGEGLDDLKRALQGRVSVFLGKSGVGKTSLLNALQPDLGLRVGAVSQATGKGVHTTSHLEMFPLESGGTIMDTPGIREFGLWDVHEDDLALFFPEMRPLVGRCKFGLDCQHDEEPGCAIRKAVTTGQISPYRYQSYLRLRLEAK